VAWRSPQCGLSSSERADSARNLEVGGIGNRSRVVPICIEERDDVFLYSLPPRMQSAYPF
jgi:hypothetical protein